MFPMRPLFLRPPVPMFCLLLQAASVSAAPKLLPVLNRPIANRTGVVGLPFSVDLNAAFGTEAIDDQVVRFESQFDQSGVPIALEIALFSHRTPVTRTNFLKYVTDGDYVNSFIHRSVPGFVIQGGGFRLVNGSMAAVPTDPPIVNEFGVSNTLGTVSMAKLGGNPDSATSQWFVSLGANTDNLDFQNGGFTVFGRVTRATFGNAQLFGNPSVFPVYDYSLALQNSALSELPLYPPNYLILFPSVTLAPLPAGQAGENPNLNYSVISNSNPAVAAVSVQAGGNLQIIPQAGQAGASTTITVRATDSVGNTVDDAFVVAAAATDSYTTWASRMSFPGGQSAIAQDADGDGLDHLSEYAFFGDPAVASRQPLPVAGRSGTTPGEQHLTLTFPVRKFTSGLSYTVLGGDSPAGPWSDLWTSAAGFGHALVVGSTEQSDRVVVTVRDQVAQGAAQRRFMRVKLTQQ